MREILFRGKRTDNGEWVYGGILQTDNWSEISVVADYYGSMYEPPSCEVDSYEVIPETVGQYTGLTDKNGVRIFEKDVISIPYKDMSGFTEYQKALVFWDSERLAWCVKFMDNEVLYLNDVVDLHSSIDIEIVDNIIDNEELVEAWV